VRADERRHQEPGQFAAKLLLEADIGARPLVRDGSAVHEE
jgi:hypothetical protein